MNTGSAQQGLVASHLPLKGNSGSSICCQEDAASYNQRGLTPQHERNKWKSEPTADRLHLCQLENTDLLRKQFTYFFQIFLKPE